MEFPQIIYKNKDFLILNKPAGLLVHSTPNIQYRTPNTELTLVNWLLENYPEVRQVGDDSVNRPGIVHRLDKDTSGIILIARNQKAFDYFKNLFQNHLIKKTYLALVYGKVKDEKGIISKPIGIKSGSTKRSVHSSKFQKQAVTEYRVIRFLKIKNQDFTLLEVMPKTGRTHQIRVHLASIEHPVMGDKLYGGKRTKLEGLHRQFLHARSIEFTAPDGERMKFEAELPQDLKSFLESKQ